MVSAAVIPEIQPFASYTSKGTYGFVNRMLKLRGIFIIFRLSPANASGSWLTTVSHSPLPSGPISFGAPGSGNNFLTLRLSRPSGVLTSESTILANLALASDTAPWNSHRRPHVCDRSLGSEHLARDLRVLCFRRWRPR